LLTNVVIGNTKTSFEVDRSTLSSATLYGSGRSTPQASSICSDHTTAAEAPTLYGSGIDHYGTLPLRTGQSTNTPLWPTYPATNQRNTPQPTLRQETLRKAYQESPSIEHVSNPSALQANGLAKLPHFCVYCSELGKTKDIGTKQDWKRHQEDYHPGTGNEWHCQYKGCGEIFYQGLPFKNHLKTHDGKVLPRDCKEVKQQQRVYACGFENCRELNFNWRCFCDHLSTHMKKGHRDWSYDRTIRNLLKQSEVSWAWKVIYGDLSPRLKVLPSQLTWEPKNTRSMKQKLEYRQFGSSLEDFLRELFFAGFPQPDVALPTAAPLPPPDFPLPPPPAMVTGAFPNAPTSFSRSLDQAEYEPSLPQAASHVEDVEQMTNEMPLLSSAYRNSYSMTEAPPLPDFEAQGFYFGEEVDTSHEFVSVTDFILESTPDHYNPTLPVQPPSTTHDNSPTSDSKKPCPKGLLSKSRSWVTRKKSQHFQPAFVLEHPDIPLNTRMPTSPSKKMATTYPTNPAVGLHSSPV